ncbi:2-oxoglutarate and Fe(II)-dependent oxygenase superfamily protein isoform 2 [Hibiscus syriacus]|uniref:2-oxoglutarate and Fe(II)-dependent oxygenase superfamily protein isoform 2 n=1 Tax=Hibiscus syriacus TaxID=106335 RepID=A0A6A2ZUC9_HIBSY|nr:2-oxoglutarate and Fe(II)-dependent oxygenase superfamily protein isoform 2 [Hibiscus syriacus]
MSEVAKKETQQPTPPTSDRKGNGVAMSQSMTTMHRLRLNPNTEHKPENYEGLQLEFSPLLFSSLERYLPPPMLSLSRDSKLHYMRDIILRYSPEGERTRAQRQREYRQKITTHYQPLHKELYTMNASNFFVPSFLKAINENKEESFRRIMTEPSQGIFTFEMLQPHFCELLLSETMLDKLMEDFIRPISKVFFSDVGGSTLDSHHGFVVEYGIDRDVELGFHVDDSEVTLNVCLGKEFTGGDLFFRGVRCDKHVNTETHKDEVLDYSHVPGRAVLHCGRHRHGARATTTGNRVNLLLWCRSSVFRELRKYQKDLSSWCGECQREKKERQRVSIATSKRELLKKEGKAVT